MSRCNRVFEMLRFCSTWIDELFNSHLHMLYHQTLESMIWLGLSSYPGRTKSTGQLDLCLEVLGVIA